MLIGALHTKNHVDLISIESKECQQYITPTRPRWCCNPVCLLFGQFSPEPWVEFRPHPQQCPWFLWCNIYVCISSWVFLWCFRTGALYNIGHKSIAKIAISSVFKYFDFRLKGFLSFYFFFVNLEDPGLNYRKHIGTQEGIYNQKKETECPENLMLYPLLFSSTRTNRPVNISLSSTWANCSVIRIIAFSLCVYLRIQLGLRSFRPHSSNTVWYLRK